jgi:hypothetical protein
MGAAATTSTVLAMEMDDHMLHQDTKFARAFACGPQIFDHAQPGGAENPRAGGSIPP